MASYVPDAGEIVWLSFTPQAGREQAGHRPAVVLSPASYNGRVGLMLCCPTTTRIKGYPFEVVLDGEPPSVALADQVRSLDWRVRRAERKGAVSARALAEIRGKAAALLGITSR
ncbi:endoribonuclease MazF [Rubrimonas sp.]|uniref:endoribonuclease MazF n=1 Tax=Rubrimonas sp. TaxID=2036015 RepID=UPI002FDD1EC3